VFLQLQYCGSGCVAQRFAARKPINTPIAAAMPIDFHGLSPAGISWPPGFEHSMRRL
jgi:hypothetical protein